MKLDLDAFKLKKNIAYEHNLYFLFNLTFLVKKRKNLSNNINAQLNW